MFSLYSCVPSEHTMVIPLLSFLSPLPILLVLQGLLFQEVPLNYSLPDHSVSSNPAVDLGWHKSHTAREAGCSSAKHIVKEYSANICLLICYKAISRESQYMVN